MTEQERAQRDIARKLAQVRRLLKANAEARAAVDRQYKRLGLPPVQWPEEVLAYDRAAAARG